MAKTKVLKARLIQGSVPKSIGGSFSLSGDLSSRVLSVNITETLGGYEGQIKNRVLYNVVLNFKSLNDLYNLLNSTGIFETILLGGSSNIPANLLEITSYKQSPQQESKSPGSIEDSIVGHDWYEFSVDGGYYEGNNPYITDSDKLSFYLTSIDPFSSVQTTQRSFGKYINTTPVMSSVELASKFSLYDLSMNVNYTFPEGTTLPEHVQINSEIMDVDSYSGNNIYINSRAVHNTINQFHLNDDNAYLLDVNRIFNSSFGENDLGDFDQFRCFAVVNDSELSLSEFEIAPGEWESFSKSSFSFFIEIPMVESFITNAIYGDFSYFDVAEIDESYLNMPISNPDGIIPFKGQLVTLGGENDGQQRIIVDYSHDLGRFFLNEDLEYQIGVGDEIIFHTSPSSTSYTGTVDPRLMNNGIYSEELVIKGGEILNLNDLGRAHGTAVLSGDVIYLWIKRSLSKNSIVSDEFPSLNFLYSVS